MPKAYQMELSSSEISGLKIKVLTLLNRFLKSIEHLGSWSKTIGRLYYRLFYRRMISREIALSGLKPGASVVHVGSGPLPMTALCLTELGFKVEALDNDPKAVQRASTLLSKMLPGHRAAVREAEGMEADFSGAEAVWISLNVMPREKVLRKAFSSLKKGGKLVYRNPRGLLSLVYPTVEAKRIAPLCPSKKVRQSLGKETLVIIKI